jgi:hypothetical protein
VRVGADQAGHHQAAVCNQPLGLGIAGLQLSTVAQVCDLLAVDIERPVGNHLVGRAHRDQRAMGDQHPFYPLSVHGDVRPHDGSCRALIVVGTGVRLDVGIVLEKRGRGKRAPNGGM